MQIISCFLLRSGGEYYPIVQHGTVVGVTVLYPLQRLIKDTEDVHDGIHNGRGMLQTEGEALLRSLPRDVA